MAQTRDTFGRRVGGYTADDMAAYRGALIAAADARDRRGQSEAPISNEIQGWRGMAKVEDTGERQATVRVLGSLTAFVVLVTAALAGVAGWSTLNACGGAERPSQILVDEVLRTCVAHGMREQFHSIAALLSAWGHGLG